MRRPHPSQAWTHMLIFYVIALSFSGFLAKMFVAKFSSQCSIGPEVSQKQLKEVLELLEGEEKLQVKLKRTIDNLLRFHLDKTKAKKIREKYGYGIKRKWANISDMGQKFQRDDEAHIPTVDYEQYRRRIQTNIGEMWSFFSSELRRIRKQLIYTQPDLGINDVLQLGAELKCSLLSNMKTLRSLDGYEEWRHGEAKNLSDLVQSRLHDLRNQNCENVTIQRCATSWLYAYGYGYEVHLIANCFKVNYANGTLLILKQSFRIKKLFKPISPTCVSEMKRKAVEGSQPFLAPKLARLKRLFGDSDAWWNGQFMKYFLKPKPATQQLLDDGIKRLGFKTPIVGIHIRRTDKIEVGEARFHDVVEYMTHVEEFFLTQEIHGDKLTRRVFVATDDAYAVIQIRRKYPNYEVICNEDGAKRAAIFLERRTNLGMKDIILDLHLLSLCDHLVCTFSSNICRSAYEIMQTRHFDAAYRVNSLDDMYYVMGQSRKMRQAVIQHQARSNNEINMLIGDLVEIHYNLWNGYSTGHNTRTKETGIFPSFKVVEKIETDEF